MSMKRTRGEKPGQGAWGKHEDNCGNQSSMHVCKTFPHKYLNAPGIFKGEKNYRHGRGKGIQSVLWTFTVLADLAVLELSLTFEGLSTTVFDIYSDVMSLSKREKGRTTPM